MFQTLSRPSAPAPICSLKAGMMRTIPQNEGFRVEPDLRRGVIQLERQSDGAMHFLWKDRVTQQVVEDILIFPGDQTLDRVETGNPSDRVFLLSFKTLASKRLFFWSQEPLGSNLTKDVDLVSEFNRVMNAPPQPQSSSRRATGSNPSSTVSSEHPQPEVGFDELTAILSGLGYPEVSSTAPQGRMV